MTGQTAVGSTTKKTRAQCDDCPAIAPDGNRNAARSHAINYGHTVRFVTEQVTTYAGVKKPPLAERPTMEQRFGQAVRAARLDVGWSQQRLSDELRKNGIELHQTGVTRLEAGTRGTGLNEAEAIAKLLDLRRSDWQADDIPPNAGSAS